ncbi:putative protein phosphatase 2C 8 isoform X2 [Castanea sativa]|uniref:putative protein phosphatase 2C 8 isoform X2 n=1 Tax=Castanea sativa TaxID=21020 RepID=UPI003F64D092
MDSISCHVYTPKQSHSSTYSVHLKKNPTSPVKRPPSNDNRWRASKRSLHPTARIALIPFLFKFESTPHLKASFGLLAVKKRKQSHNVKMDKFIQKRRKREPKAKNGVVKLNSELFSGSISVIGRQRVMEDAVRVVHEFVSVAGNPYDFFGVYDGHGGARVASACKERMHALLEKEVEEEEGGGAVVEWEKVMRSCFRKMDEEVRTGACGGGGGGGAKAEMVGSTAVVVVVGKEEVVVANCGDSRAVLCRGGVAVPLSRDHKTYQGRG